MHFQASVGSPQPAPSTPRLSWVRPLAAGLAATLAACVLTLPASAQTQSPKSQVATLNSSMDAGLFYQLLIGEIELQSGNVGMSYQVMLDAARKNKSEVLFQRSTDIALQARAGEQALAAALAWQTALPESTEAYRYVIELLVALGRPAEAMPHLSTLLKISIPSARISLINSTPRLFARVTQPEVVATQLRDTLSRYLEDPDTRVAAHVALGRVWLAADKPERALALAQRAQTLDLQAEGPALLALELMETQAGASAVLERYLQARPDNLGVRLMFVRVLSSTQRLNEAMDQLKWVTSNKPLVPAGWLALGTVELETSHPKEAMTSLRTLLDLLEKPERIERSGIDDDPQEMRQKAWLLLSQASEEIGDIKGAQTWLSKVDDPKLVRDVLQRRVQILSKKGKVREARNMIRNLTASQADDHTKVLLETLVLREAKQWSEAQKVLSTANQRLPNDVDLLYEQAMVEEKLNHLSEMERLLRKVIALKPDHHHAHNALGYSWAERNMRLPEAKVLIQRAVELAPADPFITDSLAWVEYRLGNGQEALRLLRKAYKSRPDPEIGAHLGEVLWTLGQRDEARVILRAVRKRDPRSEVLKEMLTRLRIEL